MDGAELLKKLTEESDGNYSFEYSPESFTGTEMEYALEVCNAVLDVWQPTPDHKVIINLPSTVEHSMPHVYASQVEYMSKNLKYRDDVIVSLHPHTTAAAASAMPRWEFLQALIVSREPSLETASVLVTWIS